MSWGAPCLATLTRNDVTGSSLLRLSEMETAGTSIYGFLRWQGTALPCYLWCSQPWRGAQYCPSHLKMTLVAMIAPADTNLCWPLCLGTSHGQGLTPPVDSLIPALPGGPSASSCAPASCLGGHPAPVLPPGSLRSQQLSPSPSVAPKKDQASPRGKQRSGEHRSGSR